MTPLNNNPVSGTGNKPVLTSTSYLQPVGQSSVSNQQSGYLEPSRNNQKVNKIIDTYSPPSQSDSRIPEEDTYIDDSGDQPVQINIETPNYINDDEQDIRYINDDYGNQPNINVSNDSYLLPRHASNISSSTVTSYGSNRGLLKPQSRPASSQPKFASDKIKYVPVPAPNKLSQLRPTDETDV